MLKVKFIGASEGVTGSCAWLWHTDSDTQFLVDCGMHQGSHDELWKNYQSFEFDPRNIKYVLLTHAHIDHCGLIPKLVKGGFKGWVYCTQATKDVAMHMLKDAAKLSDLYNESDIQLIKWHVIDSGGFSWNKTLRLADGLSATFKRGSHVLGACGISIRWSSPDYPGELKSIFFSGDIGSQAEGNQYLPLMKSDHYPCPQSDYIVMESTYGAIARDNEFKDAERRINTLGEIISETAFRNGGTVLIPAFSFHRTQEIMSDLLVWQRKAWAASKYAPLMGNKKIKNDGSEAFENPLRAIVHSPLGSKVSEVYAHQLSKKLSNGKYQYLNSELAGRLECPEEDVARIFRNFCDEGSAYSQGHIIRNLCVQGKHNSQTDNRYQKTIEHYSVIVASSGMCDNGPVVEYINRMKRDPKHTIILTGYQSPGSLGGQLLNGRGNSKAKVVNMSGYYSGHADQQKLLDYAFSLGKYSEGARPAKIFINHGEKNSKEALKAELLKRADQCHADDRNVDGVEIARSEWFDLNAGAYIDECKTSEGSLIERLISIEDKINRLTDEISALRLQ
ncbi:MBL fold metallo-hydrolase [uncultured Neptuniibacter sp.]|uniref:MBL fold metallo-hydrolase n=1 Tax=uncultured Neptuniibacter sp. TaxID=502143 RepID=UPI002601E0E6|nr:MBL fold metallo-hydrolase [uncultured Neptuniibacter sp.]